MFDPVVASPLVKRRVQLAIKRLGRRMKEQREHAGLSVFELARAMNAKATTIKSWERGDVSPSIPALLEFTHAIGVSLHEVLP